MASSKKESQGFLLEEIRAQQKLILEVLTGLTEKSERLTHRVERVEQKVEFYSSALLGHSNELQGLRRDVRHLAERIEESLKVHAVT